MTYLLAATLAVLGFTALMALVFGAWFWLSDRLAARHQRRYQDRLDRQGVVSITTERARLRRARRTARGFGPRKPSIADGTRESGRE